MCFSKPHSLKVCFHPVQILPHSQQTLTEDLLCARGLFDLQTVSATPGALLGVGGAGVMSSTQQVPIGPAEEIHSVPWITPENPLWVSQHWFGVGRSWLFAGASQGSFLEGRAFGDGWWFLLNKKWVAFTEHFQGRC